MNKHRLQAEIWEIQMILYLILSQILFWRDHRVLGWIVFAWACVTFLGSINKLLKAVEEDKELKR